MNIAEEIKIVKREIEKLERELEILESCLEDKREGTNQPAG